VRALTDETGTTIDTRGYEAFGTKNVEAGSDPLTYGFAGEPFQPDSFLAYHRARWMDARVGRFEGMDPYGGDYKRPTSLHRYLYGSNEPTDWVDPSGNDDMESISAAVDIITVGATLSDASTGQANLLLGGGQRLYLRWHSLTRNWLARALGAHAYVVDDDGRGDLTVFEGEAEDESALIDFGSLQVLERPFPGEPQNSPGDSSIQLPTIGIGNPKACLEAEAARINAIPNLLYSPFGPNSNTVAHDLVRTCGIDTDAPDWRLFGWNDELRPYNGFIDNPFYGD
jgi:RHS repeat-associated protein